MFFKIVLEEPESPRVQSELAQHSLVSSRLLVVEARRAFARQTSQPPTLLDAALEEVDLVDIDANVIAAAARMGPPSLRSLDAIHLASAVRTPGVDLFCAHDQRLAEAGRAAGLHVVDFR